jgi:hypothetical protein
MVNFDFLTVTCLKMVALSDVATCSLVNTDRRFRDAYCLHHCHIHGVIHHLILTLLITFPSLFS